MNQPPHDPRAGLARALAETHLECLAAEHDYRRILQEGSEHMRTRFPASELTKQPGALDHWSWHQEASNSAIETGGLGNVPDLPFQPSSLDPTP